MTSPGGYTLADAFVRLRADAGRVGPDVRAQVNKPLGDAGQEGGSNFGKRFAQALGAALAVGAAVAAKTLVDGLRQSISAASDLNEVSSKVGVVFGKQAENVRKWSKNMATDFGQSQQQALNAAATFAIYGKAAKLTGKDLFNFSTDLTALASDMASFSNSTPEEAIAAIGSALRGEFDPIERYGVLLNETTVKQEALRKGLIKTTTDALTPQQRVLAVQSLIYKQTGDAMGDFERTSASLANQQRIASAEIENLKARIGAGLLPVAERMVQTFNTKLIPAFNALWERHGPKVVEFLTRAGDKVTAFAVALAEGQFDDELSKITGWFARLKEQAGPALKSMSENVGPASKSFKEDLVPAIKELKEEGGQGLADVINVSAVALRFLAEHSDLLAKALPYLVGALVAFKVAQLAANVAMAISPALRVAELVATNKQTAAIERNTVARGAETAAIIGGSTATVGGTVAENASIASKVRAAIVEKAKTVATVAGTAATWLATAATTALGVAIKIASGPIGIIILVIAALVAGIIALYKNNETARKIIDAVWKAIKTAIKAVGDWITGTLWPSLKNAFNQLVTVVKFFKDMVVLYWTTWWKALQTGYNLLKQFVFDPLKNVITKTIPDAFKTGVAAVGRIWDSLQELAKKPVRFVVNTVINDWIIGNFNKVSGFFGGPKLNKLAPIGDGSGIPGGGGAGHAHAGDGPGRKKKGVGDGLGDWLGFIKNPLSWVKNKITAKLGQIGSHPFAQMLAGGAKNLAGSLLDKLKSLMTLSAEGGDGGSVGTGGLRTGILGVLGALRGVFGSVPVISGLRPGSRTLTGNLSYHASGRAIDIAPKKAWAAYLNATFGPRLRELITPWQEYNIHNGRRHVYTGAVWNQHNFAGGNAHIHAAMDDGGRRLLRPGLNVIPNGTGRNEPIYGPASIGEVVALLQLLIEAVERIAPGVGAEINGMGSRLRVTGRLA